MTQINMALTGLEEQLGSTESSSGQDHTTLGSERDYTCTGNYPTHMNTLKKNETM